MTTQTTTATLAYLSPGSLVLGANIRTTTREDVEQDTAFIESIRTQGVLSPVIAYTEADQTIVLAGQRRTLAALITEQATIPVMLYPAKPDDEGALRGQWDENERRAAMNESDRAHGIEQFSLLGLTADQIAQQTGESTERVSAALALTGTHRETITTHALTIEQAAALASYEDDEETTARLTEAAEEGDFDHELARVRWDERSQEVQAEAVDRLTAQGVTIIDGYPDYSADKRLAELVDKTTGDDLDPEQHTECPGHAVDLSISRGADGNPTARETIYCLGYRKNGHRDRWSSAPGATGTMSDQEKAERREVIRLNKEWDAAVDVRREFLRGIAAKKTPPAGAEAIISAWVTDYHAPTLRGPHALTEVLGLAKAEKEIATKRTTKGRHTVLALTQLLATWEASTTRLTWRSPTRWDTRLMKSLAEWGYTPSEVEQKVIKPEA